MGFVRLNSGVTTGSEAMQLYRKLNYDSKHEYRREYCNCALCTAKCGIGLVVSISQRILSLSWPLLDHASLHSHNHTLTHSRILLIACTCCYDLTKATQDKDISYSYSDSLSASASLHVPWSFTLAAVLAQLAGKQSFCAPCKPQGQSF